MNIKKPGSKLHIIKSLCTKESRAKNHKTYSNDETNVDLKKIFTHSVEKMDELLQSINRSLEHKCGFITRKTCVHKEGNIASNNVPDCNVHNIHKKVCSKNVINMHKFYKYNPNVYSIEAFDNRVKNVEDVYNLKNLMIRSKYFFISFNLTANYNFKHNKNGCLGQKNDNYFRNKDILFKDITKFSTLNLDSKIAKLKKEQEKIYEQEIKTKNKTSHQQIIGDMCKVFQSFQPLSMSKKESVPFNKENTIENKTKIEENDKMKFGTELLTQNIYNKSENNKLKHENNTAYENISQNRKQIRNSDVLNMTAFKSTNTNIVTGAIKKSEKSKPDALSLNANNHCFDVFDETKNEVEQCYRTDSFENIKVFDSHNNTDDVISNDSLGEKNLIYNIRNQANNQSADVSGNPAFYVPHKKMQNLDFGHQVSANKIQLDSTCTDFLKDKNIFTGDLDSSKLIMSDCDSKNCLKESTHVQNLEVLPDDFNSKPLEKEDSLYIKSVINIEKGEIFDSIKTNDSEISSIIGDIRVQNSSATETEGNLNKNRTNGNENNAYSNSNSYSKSNKNDAIDNQIRQKPIQEDLEEIDLSSSFLSSMVSDFLDILLEIQYNRDCVYFQIRFEQDIFSQLSKSKFNTICKPSFFNSNWREKIILDDIKLMSAHAIVVAYLFEKQYNPDVQVTYALLESLKILINATKGKVISFENVTSLDSVMKIHPKKPTVMFIIKIEFETLEIFSDEHYWIMEKSKKMDSYILKPKFYKNYTFVSVKLALYKLYKWNRGFKNTTKVTDIDESNDESAKNQIAMSQCIVEEA